MFPQLALKDFPHPREGEGIQEYHALTCLQKENFRRSEFREIISKALVTPDSIITEFSEAEKAEAAGKPWAHPYRVRFDGAVRGQFLGDGAGVAGSAMASPVGTSARSIGCNVTFPSGRLARRSASAAPAVSYAGMPRD